MVPFASYVSRGQSKPYKRINGPIVGMLLFFQLICMICGREGHGAECMVRAQKLHSEQRSFLLPWLHSRIPGADGKAPGYRLSPDHFQTVNRMIAPDWAQKMLCIIVPNRRTASPEFFSWVRRRRLLTRSRLVWLMHQRNVRSQETFSLIQAVCALRSLSIMGRIQNLIICVKMAWSEHLDCGVSIR